MIGCLGFSAAKHERAVSGFWLCRGRNCKKKQYHVLSPTMISRHEKNDRLVRKTGSNSTIIDNLDQAIIFRFCHLRLVFAGHGHTSHGIIGPERVAQRVSEPESNPNSIIIVTSVVIIVISTWHCEPQ